MPTSRSMASKAESFWRRSSIWRSNSARLSARRPSTLSEPLPPSVVEALDDDCGGILILSRAIASAPCYGEMVPAKAVTSVPYWPGSPKEDEELRFLRQIPDISHRRFRIA